MHAVPGWLPNAISCLRILLVPVWVVLAEAANRSGEAADAMAAQRGLAVATLLAIGLSDVVDGFLARRFHLQILQGFALPPFLDEAPNGVLQLGRKDRCIGHPFLGKHDGGQGHRRFAFHRYAGLRRERLTHPK